MENGSHPPAISGQALGSRHLQALQRLRDETLMLFTALDKAPKQDLQSAHEKLPRLVQTPASDFLTSYEDAKLALARNALRRILQMNSMLIDRIFPAEGQSPATELAVLPDQPAETGAAASRTSDRRRNAVELFREKLHQSGANETPAATLASLVVLEKVLGEQLGAVAGTQRPDVLEVVLVEADQPDDGAPLRVTPWHQTLRKRDTPAIDTRFLTAAFATAIVAAHEALQAAEKLHKAK